MPRRRRRRMVGFQPSFKYFKPVKGGSLNEVVLKLEEFEAVRLKDFEGRNQVEAADEMGVSQPTFSRILESARRKIADALVKGEALRIEGGDYKMV